MKNWYSTFLLSTIFLALCLSLLWFTKSDKFLYPEIPKDTSPIFAKLDSSIFFYLEDVHNSFDETLEILRLETKESYRRSDIYDILQRSGLERSALLRNGEPEVWFGPNPTVYYSSDSWRFSFDDLGEELHRVQSISGSKLSFWTGLYVQNVVERAISETEVPLIWYPQMIHISDTSKEHRILVENRVAGVVALDVGGFYQQGRFKHDTFVFVGFFGLILVFALFISIHRRINTFGKTTFFRILLLGLIAGIVPSMSLNSLFGSVFEVSKVNVTFIVQCLVFGGLGYVALLYLMKQRRLYGITWYPRTIVFSVTAGIGLALLWYYMPIWVLDNGSEFWELVFETRLTPNVGFLLYSGSVFVVFSVAFMCSVAFIWFLLGTEQDQLDWVPPLTIAGFSGTFAGILFLAEESSASSLHLSGSILMFILIFFIAFQLFKKPKVFLFFSRFRLIGSLSFLLALWFFGYFFNSYQESIQGIIQKEQQSIISEHRTGAELSLKSIKHSLPLQVARLNTTFVEPEYLVRSIIRDMTKFQGDNYVWTVFGKYNESWELLYNSGLLEFDTRLGGFPRTTTKQSLGDFYETTTLDIGEKSLELLLVVSLKSESFSMGRLDFADWEYNDSGGSVSEIRELSEPGLISRGETVLRSANNNGVRLMVKLKSPSIIEYLFLFTRQFLIFLSFGLFFYGILYVLSWSQPGVLETRQLLRFRLVDGFMLASLLFLIVLIVATEGISRYLESSSSTQIEEFVRREYRNNTVRFDGFAGSTLSIALGDRISYPVFSKLSESGRDSWREKIEFGERTERLVFRKSKNDPNVIFASLIPNVDKNPLIFTITNTLIVFYVFIFGLFLVGTSLITRHLTSPLQKLSVGLRRVATGELDGGIKIDSQDEVGDLANAYNVMIYRLKDLQKELADAERQAAWTEMARQVAHEIKNPLTPMKLSLQHMMRLVNDNHKNAEEVEKAVTRIAQGVIAQIETLSNIASDFSKFAKPQTEDIEHLAVHDLLLQVGELYRHDRRLNLVYDFVERDLFVKASVDDLKRVFINLIKNSDEAMPEGGVLMLRTYEFKSRVYIEVVDNGEGIPVEVQDKIFIPNFSTKTSGTGLGLAICKKIVQNHGGDISFASVSNAGTTFTISLPTVGKYASEPTKPTTSG